MIEKIILRMGILQSPIIEMEVGPTRRVRVSFSGIKPFFMTTQDVKKLQYNHIITFIGSGRFIQMDTTDIEFFDMEYIQGL